VSRSERLKEELSLIRLLIGISLAADFSAIAWLGQNHQQADWVTITAACWVIVDLTAALVILGRRIYKLFDQLENC
jgi:uncharacterized membrane protein YcjF (UPF0283 family)